MTEEEARTKWCPFTNSISWIRVNGATTGAISVNRALNQDSGEVVVTACMLCIASDCAAWREDKRPLRKKKDGVGYCGLAGKP